jgi:hypothetical protein
LINELFRVVTERRGFEGVDDPIQGKEQGITPFTNIIWSVLFTVIVVAVPFKTEGGGQEGIS